MAEMQQNESRNKRGAKRSKKLSTRVDLTPMVDLGFLLITFFIFTTTLNEPKAFTLVVPSDKPVIDPPQTGMDKTLNLILSTDNKIVYYGGISRETSLTTDYSSAGLRAVILNKMKSVAQQYGDAKKMVVLIKPTEGANYQNVVNVLDEMKINGVGSYVLMDADKEERKIAGM